MDGIRAFVTDGKLVGENCDRRTYFWTEMGIEHLDGDINSRHTNGLNSFCHLN